MARGIDLSAAQKLTALRAALAEGGVDGFYLTRTDMFQGEEVRAGDEYLAWLTSFTGSAGAALILPDSAAVFTDSRYRVQIRQQIDSSCYESYDQAEKTIAGWMAEKAADGRVRLGFDSWALSKAGRDRLPKKLGKADVEWVGLPAHPLQPLWGNRPRYEEKPIFFLDDDLTGQSAADKQAQIAEILKKEECSLQLITSVDAVNWLCNIRGRDLDYTPLHLCFALINQQAEVTFIGAGQSLIEAGFTCMSWAELAGYFQTLSSSRIACDPATLPVAIEQYLLTAGLIPVYRADPLLDLKAAKSGAEIRGFKSAHHLDGIAMCRFWHWLENEGARTSLSEVDIGVFLQQFRAMSADYLCDSFATIAGFRGNSAIVHYRAVKGGDRKLDGPGVLLVDSGAHYRFGTTDITRTFFIGDEGDMITDEITKKSSYVLSAYIEIARAIFAVGTTGSQLDAITRAPLWAQNIDFGHGTGHGVGHVLSVHEGPVSISKRCHLPLKLGQVFSNEPGYYEEGQFGIRHENLAVVTQKAEGFLQFETLTCFPFDRKLIDISCLTEAQRDWLNEYHRNVYECLSPDLEPELQHWLAGKSAPL